MHLVNFNSIKNISKMMGTKVLFTIIVNFLVISTTVTAICEYEQDGAYIAHPESRHMFYYCWGGIGYEGECYAGQEFDPFYRVCTDIQEDDWGTPSCDRVQNGVSWNEIDFKISRYVI